MRWYRTSLIGHFHFVEAAVDAAFMLAYGHKRIIFLAVPKPKQIARIPLYLGNNGMITQAFESLKTEHRTPYLMGQTTKLYLLQLQGTPATRQRLDLGRNELLNYVPTSAHLTGGGECPNTREKPWSKLVEPGLISMFKDFSIRSQRVETSEGDSGFGNSILA